MHFVVYVIGTLVSGVAITSHGPIMYTPQYALNSKLLETLTDEVSKYCAVLRDATVIRARAT
jgi:hypothetical protein